MRHCLVEHDAAPAARVGEMATVFRPYRTHLHSFSAPSRRFRLLQWPANMLQVHCADSWLAWGGRLVPLQSSACARSSVLDMALRQAAKRGPNGGPVLTLDSSQIDSLSACVGRLTPLALERFLAALAGAALEKHCSEVGLLGLLNRRWEGGSPPPPPPSSSLHIPSLLSSHLACPGECPAGHQAGHHRRKLAPCVLNTWLSRSALGPAHLNLHAKGLDANVTGVLPPFTLGAGHECLSPT